MKNIFKIYSFFKNHLWNGKVPHGTIDANKEPVQEHRNVFLGCKTSWMSERTEGLKEGENEGSRCGWRLHPPLAWQRHSAQSVALTFSPDRVWERKCWDRSLLHSHRHTGPRLPFVLSCWSDGHPWAIQSHGATERDPISSFNKPQVARAMKSTL